MRNRLQIPKAPRISESEEQKTVMQWAEWNAGRYPQLKWLYHIPNGGKRSKAEAARFKTEGVKAGVSDLCLPSPSGKYHGLYVEMKALDGTPEAEQLEFLRFVRSQGYAGFVCYGADEAIKVIEKYIKGEF